MERAAGQTAKVRDSMKRSSRGRKEMDIIDMGSKKTQQEDMFNALERGRSIWPRRTKYCDEGLLEFEGSMCLYMYSRELVMHKQFYSLYSPAASPFLYSEVIQSFPYLFPFIYWQFKMDPSTEARDVAEDPELLRCVKDSLQRQVPST